VEFYEVVKKRRTVREFQDKAVPGEAIRRVLAAGLRAPSNAHLKSWQFVLLRDREKRARAVVKKLKARDITDREEIERFLVGFDETELKKVYRRSLPRQQSMMLEAPELLLVCYKMKPQSECRIFFEMNPLASVWMCIENIMLALAAEGLFGCTYTPYESKACDRLFTWAMARRLEGSGVTANAMAPRLSRPQADIKQQNGWQGA
jgi:nitroreductase